MNNIIIPFRANLLESGSIPLDNIAGEGYYENSVETQSPKFQGPSQKYEPI